MISLRTPTAIKSTIELLADNQLQAQMTEQLTESIDLTHFLIIQPGDTAADAENELGWSPLVNFVDGACHGQPDLTPSWEWVENNGG